MLLYVIGQRRWTKEKAGKIGGGLGRSDKKQYFLPFLRRPTLAFLFSRSPHFRPAPAHWKPGLAYRGLKNSHKWAVQRNSWRRNLCEKFWLYKLISRPVVCLDIHLATSNNEVLYQFFPSIVTFSYSQQWFSSKIITSQPPCAYEDALSLLYCLQ